MVEFNLLPDIKIEYLKTKRLEHLVVSTSVIVSCVCLAILIFLIVFVDVYQKTTLNHLNSSISASTAKLNSSGNLNKILTIQNQLETIPKLEDQSPEASRLFSYLSQLTPINATISSLNISFSANNVSITGGADTLATVNTYVDTLKYSTLTNQTTKQKNVQAFSSVVLSSFNYTTSNSNATTPAQYTITFNFDPDLFNSADNVKLVVPNEITTQSILGQPTLFKSNTVNGS